MKQLSAIEYWANYLDSLKLSVLTCKLGNIKVSSLTTIMTSELIHIAGI
jgi:hypothetical protein